MNKTENQTTEIQSHGRRRLGPPQAAPPHMQLEQHSSSQHAKIILLKPWTLFLFIYFFIKQFKFKGKSRNGIDKHQRIHLGLREWQPWGWWPSGRTQGSSTASRWLCSKRILSWKARLDSRDLWQVAWNVHPWIHPLEARDILGLLWSHHYKHGCIFLESLAWCKNTPIHHPHTFLGP